MILTSIVSAFIGENAKYKCCSKRLNLAGLQFDYETKLEAYQQFAHMIFHSLNLHCKTVGDDEHLKYCSLHITGLYDKVHKRIKEVQRPVRTYAQ